MSPLSLALLRQDHFYHMRSVIALHSAQVPSVLSWMQHSWALTGEEVQAGKRGEVYSEFGLNFPLTV